MLTSLLDALFAIFGWISGRPNPENRAGAYKITTFSQNRVFWSCERFLSIWGGFGYHLGTFLEAKRYKMRCLKIALKMIRVFHDFW